MQLNKGVSIYGTVPRPPVGYGPPKGMGYGIWEILNHLAGNQLSGHTKVWLMGGYGLRQRRLYSDRSADRIQKDVLVVAGSVPHSKSSECLLFDERAFRSCKRLSDDSWLTEVNHGPKLVASS